MGFDVAAGKAREMREMKAQFLTGQKLYLRPLEEADVGEKYLGRLNDYETTRFVVTGRFLVRREDLSPLP